MFDRAVIPEPEIKLRHEREISYETIKDRVSNVVTQVLREEGRQKDDEVKKLSILAISNGDMVISHSLFLLKWHLQYLIIF